MKISEASLQAQIVQTLRVLGYTVMETGKTRSAVRCPHCKGRHYATGWQGNTVGLPDLYIHYGGWVTGTALAVELKTKTGTVRKAQQALAESGCSIIARSLEDVLETVRDFEDSQGFYMRAERIRKLISFGWVGEKNDSES
jgi:hypothetical protein